jgi:arabinofuranan 3-O-arabinosyltransferase
MVADTKFDLLTAPGRFLAAAVHLWDPIAAFGQLQNQAYGYAWPMGPFFWAGHLLHLPEWVVQRLWWSLLLCLAFFGVVRLAQRLRLGSPLTQVVAGFAFVLSPRITTLLGGVSVEIWPMALAPWVLLPLVSASERGSVRRGAALSALLVATCGGVNAVAVAAVLPLGVLWILTRAAGPRKWPLLGWWTLFTTVATFWWVGPLLVLGRYSPPFLDYIENATITTVPTGLARTLVGTSDWVAYFAGIDYPAGQHLVTTPFLILDAAGIVSLGLLGMLLRDNPHQRFLVLGLLTGVVLVGFGYSGDLAGWWAGDRTSLLDAALAPFRNLHKFDVVLRLPLVLGLAHALRVVPALLRGAGATAALRLVQVATALALVALALPWLQDEIAPRAGVSEVPAYWTAAADWLHQNDQDGTVSLELPAAAFGVYDWGNVHDDVMQGLATSPWAVRNVIPLAPPGNVVFLDAVTRVVESGHPSATLASYLAANGVSRLIVRNDLDRFQTGAPDPVYVRSVLAGSPGLTLARSFGPRLGTPLWARAPNGRTRVVRENGFGGRVGSIDIYDVSAPAGARLTAHPVVVAGGPDAGLRAGLAGPAAHLLPEDVHSGSSSPSPVTGQVLTDSLRRQETNFAAVRWNRSATMPAGAPYRLVGPEHAHRFLEDPERWQTTAVWTGSVSAVSASSSEAYADALPPLRVGAHPGAALDGDPATGWRSARQLDPTGQWWQEDFTGVEQVPRVTVRLSPDSVAVPRLAIRSDQGTRLVPAPAPGHARTYDVHFPVATYLRVTVAGRDLALPGSVGIAEVGVPGLTAQRYLQLPLPDDRFPVDAISLQRDPDRAACVLVGWALPCDDALVAPGEDGDTLARRFTTTTPGDYRISGTVSLRRTTHGRGLLRSGETASVNGQVRDVAEGPLAAIDGDHHTTWIAQRPHQALTLRFTRPQRLRSLEVRLNKMAPAARPTTLEVRAAGHRRLVTLGGDGKASLPGWRATSLRLRVVDSQRALGTDGARLSDLPAGITGVVVDGQSPTRAPSRPRTYGCGDGPLLRIGDTVLLTRLRASSKELLRGQAAALRVCGSRQVPLAGTTDVLAAPSSLFRVDSLTLQRVQTATSSGASGSGPLTTVVPVARDGRGDPTAVRVPARSQPTVLSLPQNLNAGWTAAWRGHQLPVQRVDGWRQGWLLPAGGSGTVTLRFAPAGTFTALLLAGAGLLVLMALGLGLAVLRARRRGSVTASLPALGAARPGVLDLVIAVAAGGLLCGWWGLGGVAAAVAVGLLVPRFAGWSLLAAVLTLVGSLALSWSVITDRSWAVTWSQAWSLAAVCCAVGALAALRRLGPGTTAGPEDRAT